MASRPPHGGRSGRLEFGPRGCSTDTSACARPYYSRGKRRTDRSVCATALSSFATRRLLANLLSEIGQCVAGLAPDLADSGLECSTGLIIEPLALQILVARGPADMFLDHPL